MHLTPYSNLMSTPMISPTNRNLEWRLSRSGSASTFDSANIVGAFKGLMGSNFYSQFGRKHLMIHIPTCTLA